jgi:hypothetical protein
MSSEPIPMLLTCPSCGVRHIDHGEFAVKVHHTHSCQTCGTTWRPAVVATVGVQFLPGFKDDPNDDDADGLLDVLLDIALRNATITLSQARQIRNRARP